MNQESLEKEFTHAFAEYGDAIFRFCIVKVSNKERAEDFTQEVFTRYWHYLRDGKEITNTRALLYTIANNMAKDWYKKKKALSLDEHMETGYEPQEHHTDAQLHAEYAEVLETIDELDEKDKQVLLLRFVEGLEPKDIAFLLDETANAISVRLNRATKRLQHKLHA